MRETVLPELIRKYLNGKSTQEETAAVEAWYDSFEGEPDPVPGLSHAEQQQLKDKMFSKVMQNLRAMNGLPQPEPIRAFKRVIYVISSIAALFLLVFGISRFVAHQQGFSSEASSSGATGGIVVQNRESTIRRLDLPDGSTAWLRPRTTIRYPESFSGTREVYLAGEAFFEVSRDPSHPFVIHSKHIVTRVLGTSFNIRAYKEDISAEVSVLTGKVAVQLETPGRSREEAVILLPNQKAVFGQENQRVAKQEHVPEKEMQIWKKKDIAFDNTPVREVVKALNAAFDIKIEVEDEQLNDYVLRADFTSQNLPDILEMLKRSLGVEYEINGQHILLKPEK